ncbi:LysM peptidoglycan-binding domain-containing protein [Roseibacillus ishigakijimensis]|uniref:LysM peptidoglycan-binding domain-containing protein n=1 Tax=Roseibacillus ishigakijimensis TaxID=454146 RepID=A0A934RLV1_9BACT|nr:LysM peptidoglycan-binding domain-containing protein [Roseibacillus ishigakijimensis]MBK1833774.1 LysM peptidoglycan-binding domain-containing protein [Roseibacillus ishigakijimensis]
MKVGLFFLLGGILTLILTGCGGSGDIYHPDMGPFDENGDYVTALADEPVKKRFFARRSKPDKSETSQSESVSQPSRPLLAKVEAQPRQTITTVSAPAPQAVVRSVVREPQPAPRILTASTKPAVAPKPVVKKVVAAVPQPAAKPKPAPKPVAAKPKPAPKPAAPSPRRHTVVKDDTLYSLSRRYGTTVAAIQKANGLGGTTIRLGQSLLIPR